MLIPYSQMDSKLLFTSPYDQKTFTKLLKQFLGDEYQDEGRYETKEIGHGFEYLTHYSRLGEIVLDNEGYKEQVLVLEITQKSINDARVSITKETIKLLKKDIFQGFYTVLVTFKSEANPDNWRFSLIKSNDGKTWNNARRFSYYLGKNEGYKTPKQYLIDAGQIKNLNDLVSRFDVEVVRKEFFNLYINLFLELYQEVKKYEYCFRSVNNEGFIDLVTFSKNLMGKMIFLYFIQKKGWLGLTVDQNFKDHPGDPQFFKNNFDTRLAREENLFHGAINFYNDFLEPLFYSGLNKKNPNDWHEKLQMKVPYLNGGLFEEEYRDRETTPLPLENNLFKAIVDAFDTYNFTIDENDPMDQEIAVDPEMLGKIFENMISINNNNIDEIVNLYLSKKKFKGYPSPDNISKIDIGKEINKKYGAYYTPREIVQYMAREALIGSMIEFLRKKLIDRNSEELETVVRTLRECKDKHLTTKDEIEDKEGQSVTYQALKSVAFDVKEYLLYDKNSEIKPLSILDPAVGSGAFPMGILQEMTGLVEYLIDTFGLEKKSRYEIKQSIIRDSIYGVDIDPGAVDIARLRFWLSLIVDANEPIPLPNLEFKFVCANSLLTLKGDTLFTNNDIIYDLKLIKYQYFQTSENETKQKLQSDFGEKKLELLGFKDHKFRSDFPSLKKFNEYIAELGQQASDAKNKQFNEREPFDTKKSNLRFDCEMMFDKPYFDIVIGNPPYALLQNINGLRAEEKNTYAEIYQSSQYKVDLYHLFIERGLCLLNNNGILSFITPNTFLTNKNNNKLREFIAKNSNINKIINCEFSVFDQASVDVCISLLQKTKNNIEEHCIECYSWQEGDFQPNLTNAFSNNTLSTDNGYNINIKKDKQFIRSEGIKPLIEYAISYFGIQAYDKKSSTFSSPREGLVPIIDGDDIVPYTWSKYKAYFDYKSENIKSGGDINIYSKDRIVIRQIGSTPVVGLVKGNILSSNTMYSIVPRNGNDIYYLYAILSSNLMKFIWNNKYSDNKKIFPKIKGFQIKELPIKASSSLQNKAITAIILKVIENAIDTSLIRKIDILVYKLYELTLEDSQIIDPTLTQDEWDRVNFE